MEGIARRTIDRQPHWLDRWTSQEISEIIEEIGATRHFRAAIQRRARKIKQQRRRDQRAANYVLWRGQVTENLPLLTWREVTRGTRSRAAKPDIRIGDLGVPLTWHGVDLPVGTRLVVDLDCPSSVIGSTAEIVSTPHGIRVHVWRGKRQVVEDTNR